MKSTIKHKPIEAEWNMVGGVDLITERDSGNTIRILTGNSKSSLDFWKRLRDKANDVVGSIESLIEEQ